MSVFDVAYLQTRSFGTNEYALRRHRDGHLVLASDRADAHLLKTPLLRYLNVFFAIGFGLLPKSKCALVCSRHITAASPWHNVTDRQADRVYSGFVFYQVSPVSSHMPKSCKFGYFVRCPGVSEWVCELTWLFIYIGAFQTFDFTVSGHQNHKQTSVFSLLTLPHSSTIFHLCLLPPPDAFEHSSLVLAFSFLVFPTIFSFYIFLRLA